MTREELDAIRARFWYRSTNPENYKAFIKTVDIDVHKLITEVERLRRERDAAVADLNYFAGNFCDSCIHFHTPIEDAEPCHKCTVLIHSDTSYWQWRGVQEADNAGN